MIEQITYYCPMCGAYSGDIVRLPTKHEPTEQELKEFPDVAHEVFECVCKRIWGWNDLEKRSIK